MKKVVLCDPVLPGIYGTIPLGAVSLGLMSISAFLKSHSIETKIFIFGKHKLSEFVSLLANAFCLGISCMTGPYLSAAIYIAKMAKKIRPELPIIFGGYHPTLLPEQTISNPYVDVVVRGMGEETMFELVKALEARKEISDVAGITYKQSDKIIATPKRENIDINKLPMMDYSGVIADNDFGYIPEFPYLSSRGCPYQCSYCVSSTVYGRKINQLSIQRVIEEIRYLVEKYKVHSFFFYDDNFFVDKRRVEEFCDKLKENNLKINWKGYARCDCLPRYEDKTIAKLKDSGLTWLGFGAESGSERILIKISKGHSKEMILNTAKITHRYGIDCDFSFMSGLPGETMDDFYETLKLIERLLVYRRVTVRIFSFTPYPATQITSECIDAGFKIPSSLEGWGNFIYQYYIASWISKKHASLLKTMSVMSEFFGINTIRSVSRNALQKFIMYLLYLDAKIRLKYKIFLFPIEWKIIRQVNFLVYKYRIFKLKRQCEKFIVLEKIRKII